jgi:ribosome-binding ATPase YchF (GTP1/OBG family)
MLLAVCQPLRGAVPWRRLPSSSTPSGGWMGGLARGAHSSGLVGMPNVGKSTLFNALVRAQIAQASNFPFTTISPQTALVAVPDARLEALATLSGSAKVMPGQLAFTDIAGLIVEGASEGAGLGNAFLGDIRSCNAIIQVVRCFEDSEVIHVCDSPDPTRDIRIIEGELLLADLQSIEKRIGKEGARSKSKAVAAEADAQARLLAAVRPLLEAGIPARAYAAHVPSHERLAWERLGLISQKPMVFACNVDAEGVHGNAMTASVQEYVWAQEAEHARTVPPPTTPGGARPARSGAAAVTVVCAKLEAELSALGDEERAEYLSEYGLKASGLDALIAESARLLQVQSFYTTGPQEARSWSIPSGATAPEAAGAIHSDMQRGFIKAEVISYDDYVKYGGEAGVRAAGRLRSEGKEYIVAEGDVMVFKFNAAQGKKE